MLSISTLIVVVAAVLSNNQQVAAWSGNQHKMVGQIASYFLTKEAADVLPTLLTETNYTTLAAATVWADAVKKVDPYKWSASSHFIDYLDVVAVDVQAGAATTKNCTPVYDETVVCKDGFCVTNAITNYTIRADAASKNSDDVRREAVKFLAHYVGDITQPLHNCFHDVGGNQWYIMWNGSIFEPPPFNKYQYNLHFIWDQFMIDADVLLNYNNSYDNYVQGIIGDVTYGKWADAAANWIKCENPLVIKETGRTIHTACPLEWSSLSNEENCKTVWENLGANNTGVDLFTNGYYEANKDVARMYVAAAGVRLAALLNEILPAVAEDKPSSGNNDSSSASATSVSTYVASSSAAETNTYAPSASGVSYSGNHTLMYSAAGKQATSMVALLAAVGLGMLFL